MADVSIQELRDRVEDVIDRVEAGERLTLTREDDQWPSSGPFV